MACGPWEKQGLGRRLLLENPEDITRRPRGSGEETRQTCSFNGWSLGDTGEESRDGVGWVLPATWIQVSSWFSLSNLPPERYSDHSAPGEFMIYTRTQTQMPTRLGKWYKYTKQSAFKTKKHDEAWQILGYRQQNDFFPFLFKIS